VEILTSDGPVPLADLSLGYKTMFAWSLDLAIRMFWQNPDIPFPLEEPAIVIIDEIDLHLHPKWQRDIRDLLLRHFPNTQFICTGHSPFMAQASAGDNLAVLHRRGDHVYIQNDPEVIRTWRIGQYATSDLFGIGSERGKDIEIMVNRRRELLDKSTRDPQEEGELRELDATLSALPVDAEGPTKTLIDKLEELTNAINRQTGAAHD
jgi:predicted ATP-binding protein involved in virulence